MLLSMQRCLPFKSPMLRLASTIRNKQSGFKKLQVVSPPVGVEHEGSKLVTGMTITPQHLVWAVLDNELNEIMDCGCCQIVSEEQNCTYSTLLDAAFRVKKEIPASDIYVMEDGSNIGAKPTLSMTKNLLMFDSMLSALLNENYNPEAPYHKVFHMQSRVVLNLFKLKVGNERISSQHIVRKMIKSSKILGYDFDDEIIDDLSSQEKEEGRWIDRLRWTDAERAKRIWSRGDVWRENISNAILVATAFTDVCLKADAQALQTVYKRTTS